MRNDPRRACGRVPVNKIIPFSSVDGPGNRTAVFVQGCNFNCHYCHNPETRAVCISCGDCVATCPAGALTLSVEGQCWPLPSGGADAASTAPLAAGTGATTAFEAASSETPDVPAFEAAGECTGETKLPRGLVLFDPAKCVGCDTCIHTCTHDASPRIRYMNAEEVYAEVRRNVPFIRGVTVSGGECTFYPAFLHDLAVLAKQDGLGFLLDSNGTYDFEADPADLLSVIDGVMLDIKAYDAADHRAVTDVDNTLVLRNMRFLADRGQLYEVRTVIVPELFDTEKTIVDTARALQPYLSRQKHWPQNEGTSIRYKIIKYRPFGVREAYRSFTPPTDDWLEHLAALAREEGMTDIVII